VQVVVAAGGDDPAGARGPLGGVGTAHRGERSSRRPSVAADRAA
jgi:hypothetical protein